MSNIVKGLAFVGLGVLLGPLGLGLTGIGLFAANASIAVGLSLISSQLFAPKIQGIQQQLAERQTTVRSTTEHRTVVYGQAMTSGPVAYHNLSGDDGEDAWYVIPLAWGRSHSVVSVWLDGNEIPVADIDWTPGTGGADGSGTGEVSTEEWNSTSSPPTRAVRIYWALGDDDQVAMGKLTDAFSDWQTVHRGRGITYGVARFRYVVDTEKIWEEKGQPGNIKFVLKGRLCYDPRRDHVNSDPGFNTISKSYGAGLRWFAGSTQATALDTTVFSTVTAYSANWLRYSGSAVKTTVSERVPVDSTQRYRITVDARRIAGATSTNSFGVYFYDSNGDVLSNTASPEQSDATGWVSITSVHLWKSAQIFPITPTTYTFDFGGAATPTIPTGAVAMALMFQGNTGSAASTVVDITDYSVFEYANQRHQQDDSDTWDWTDNPVVCLFDYMTQIMSVPFNRIDWDDAIVAADACDVAVNIAPAGTETRFTCNGALSLGDSHKANIEKILSSGDLQLRWKQGAWSVKASVWEEPTITIDEDWLTDDSIDVKGMDGLNERFNTVRGFFIDPERTYEPVEFPEVTAAEYVSRDGGVTIPYDLELHMTNTHTMAQRLAYRLLEQSDNQLIARARVNANGAQLAIGDRVNVDWWPLGWTDGGNSIANSASFGAFENDGVYLTEEGITSSGSTAWKCSVQTAETGHIAILDQPDEHEAESHFPASTAALAVELYHDLTSFGNDTGNTFCCEFKPGTMNSQFITPAVVDISASPNTILWTGTLDLTDGSTTNNSAWAQNYARVVPLPNGWVRLIIYIQEGLNDGDNVRFYIIRDVTATEGDFFYINAPQAIPYFSWNPLYVETTGSPITTTPQTMRVIEWKRLDDGRYDITLRQDEEADYDDPLRGEYSVYDNGAIVAPTITVAAPSGLTSTSQQGSIIWDWDDPPSRLYKFIQVWVSGKNDRSTARLVSAVRGAPFTHNNTEQNKRWYAWVRAVDASGRISDWHPSGATSGVTGTSLSPNIQFGLLDPDFDLSDSEPSPYWEEALVVSGVGASWSTDIFFNAGGGVNGSNAFEFRMSDTIDCVANLRSVARYRCPEGGFYVRVRYKASSGSPHTFRIGVAGYSDPTSDATVGLFSSTWSTAYSPSTVTADDGWHTATHNFTIPEAYDIRFVRVYVQAIGNFGGYNSSSDRLTIDSIWAGLLNQ